jgi:aminoglycoside phosphotransferase (APT) family kinase protein
MYYTTARSHNEVMQMGLPEQQQLVDHYCRVSGRPPIQNWPFYMAFSMFRSAAIVQGVVKRGMDGNSASDLSLSYQPMIRYAAQTGWRLASE